MNPLQTAIRLSGVSVLVADAALVAGGVVSGIYGLGTEALPLTSSHGLEQLGRLASVFTLREALWLAYPIFVLPQGIALYVLLRDRAPYLLWPLVLWCSGLTLGIGIDVVTVGIAGVWHSVSRRRRRHSSARRVGAHGINRTTLLAQFVCDNLGATLVYPFLPSPPTGQALFHEVWVSRRCSRLCACSWCTGG